MSRGKIMFFFVFFLMSSLHAVAEWQLQLSRCKEWRFTTHHSPEAAYKEQNDALWCTVTSLCLAIIVCVRVCDILILKCYDFNI